MLVFPSLIPQALPANGWPFPKGRGQVQVTPTSPGPTHSSPDPCVLSTQRGPVSQEGAGAHLVGAAEAQPQLGQDLQHAQATVAFDSVKGPDARQALQKAQVLPHDGPQVSHEEGTDLTLHNKKGECETPPSPLLVCAGCGPPKNLPQAQL